MARLAAMREVEPRGQRGFEHRAATTHGDPPPLRLDGDGVFR